MSWKRLFLIYLCISFLPVFGSNYPRSHFKNKRYSLIKDSVRFTSGVALLLVSLLCFERSYGSAYNIFNTSSPDSSSDVKKSRFSLFRNILAEQPIHQTHTMNKWENYISALIATVGWGTGGLLVFKLAVYAIMSGFD